MDRAPGLSVRLKLTLSYAGFLMFAGALMLAAMWVFLYVPDAAIIATVAGIGYRIDTAPGTGREGGDRG